MRQEMNYELAAIGNNIRRLRKQKGFAQEALAEAIDVSCMTISRIENGTAAMNILNLKKIAQVLDATTDEILETQEPKIQQIC